MGFLRHLQGFVRLVEPLGVQVGQIVHNHEVGGIDGERLLIRLPPRREVLQAILDGGHHHQSGPVVPVFGYPTLQFGQRFLFPVGCLVNLGEHQVSAAGFRSQREGLVKGILRLRVICLCQENSPQQKQGIDSLGILFPQ